LELLSNSHPNKSNEKTNESHHHKQVPDHGRYHPVDKWSADEHFYSQRDDVGRNIRLEHN
jgi:hypothetical protein